MTFSAARTRSFGDALLFVGWLLLTSLLVAWWAHTRSPDWLQVGLWGFASGSVLLATLLLYRVWTLRSLAYRIERNALIIRWRTERVIVPLAQIRKIVQNPTAATRTANWWRWPTPFMRVEAQREMLPQRENNAPSQERPLLIMMATRPLEQCLLLDVGHTRYALSPRQHDAFYDLLQKTYELGPATNLTLDDSQTFDVQMILGVDRIARRVLVAGLIGVLALFVVLWIRYPFLPETLAVRFNAQGLPELVRPKSQLFLLPLIGLITWIVNTIWGIWMAARNQPTGAYLLWSGSVIVEGILFMALLSLVLY